MVQTILLFCLLLTNHNDYPQNKEIRLGDYAFGGIVFWIDPSGKHGLVCSREDLVRGTFWNDTVNVKGKESSRFMNRAMKACSEYSVVIDGILYDDWYFPSRDEVFIMCEKQKLIERTALQHSGSGFMINNELSPTEFCNDPAWDLVFNYSYRNYDYPNSKFNVRAVRTF